MTWLTRDGLLAALVVGTAVVVGPGGGGWRGAVLLLAFFISGSVLTRVSGGPGGRRNARQVVANGGVAAAAALAGSWPALAGALAAATADTWATEIGSFARREPRLITTWAPVPRGTSGGITLLGTAGGAAGGGLIGGLAWVLERPGGMTVAAAGVIGMLLDSVLGATLQGDEPGRRSKGYAWLDNDGVNLAATMTGALVAVSIL